ncbi:Membrane-bound lytic murein transglycosylase B precursor [Delftia tsuruhatensis]|nr:Membrane-bound lytic murein transglycosylase B precursor [Delftia tsuruhatensis]CAC9690232.1 Membrane-bound lytic murein transglycosylase B precursor [Delftia tsuruhatensis]
MLTRAGLAAALAAALLGGCASRPTPVPAPEPAQPAPSPIPAAETSTASADAPAQAEAASFEAWKRDFARKALDAGISEKTVRGALEPARLQQRAVQLDRSQPEFTRTPWQYLDSAVSATRITQGRAKLREAAAPLQSASQRYGVPAEVIAAIWGMESNYGGNFGNFATVDALATLAFDGRRADWAQKELLAALRIIDNGDIDAAHMVGSWAGAMGHTQFLPSVFLAYAVDADGDGRRDIWGSLPDVTASTANYLAHSGWKPGEPWGVEVRLPPGFDHARAETSVRQGSAQWAAEGVQAMDGSAPPAMADASIIAPAGARGPAFMVGTNFRTILRYNNSVNYALGVGLLSQQLAGGPGVQAAWPRDLTPLTRQQLRTLQTALNERGFSAGSADGVMGPATRAGLRQFQQSQGLVADGYPTQQLLQLLRP